MTEQDETNANVIRPISRRALIFYGLCRFIAVGTSRLYFPGEVIGKRHLPSSGAYVLAPVHRSNVDWLVVARVTRRRLRYIVKQEVWKVKAVGRFIELLGAFPVRRASADRESLHRCLEVLLAGEPLVLFPEGTRGAGPLVGDLREGAAYLALRAGVPIVPVGLAGTESAMPRGKRLPRPARVAIVIGAPLDPRAAGLVEEGRTRVARSATHQLNAELQDAIQRSLTDALGSLNGRRRSKAIGLAADSTRTASNETD